MAHGDRSVDVFVRKLRAKIQKHSPGWTYIHTHFGIGYRFEPEPAGIVEERLRPAGPPVAEPGPQGSPRGAEGEASSRVVHGTFTTG
jgi:hypothetical protein